MCLAGVEAQRQLDDDGDDPDDLVDAGSSDYKHVKRFLAGRFRNRKQFVEKYAVPLTRFLVQQHWRVITELAEHLLEAGELSALDLDVFLRKHWVAEQLDLGPVFYDR